MEIEILGRKDYIARATAQAGRSVGEDDTCAGGDGLFGEEVEIEVHGIVHHSREVADNHIDLEDSRSLGSLRIFEHHGEKGFNDA